MGLISTLSFDPTKNLPNYGSGGMVLTDDPAIFDYMQNIRDNGKAGNHVIFGTNSRMSETDCAQMLVKLKYFDGWQERRTQIAEYFNSALQDFVSVPRANHGVTHAWSKYIIQTNSSGERSKIMNAMMLQGIDSKLNYSKPLTAMNNVLTKSSSERAVSYSKKHLAIPIYPELTDAEVDSIVDAIKSVFV